MIIYYLQQKSSPFTFKSGFLLIELFISMVIMSIGTLAIAHYHYTSTAMQYDVRKRMRAITLASSTWENITDPNYITISQLQFSKTEDPVDVDGSGSGTATINIRNVGITITGFHVENSTVSRTLTYHVRLRNDKFVP